MPSIVVASAKYNESVKYVHLYVVFKLLVTYLHVYANEILIS